MPPPKRPFTTSSLTSTLKSTIANQPLLSNSIDKLSSQASSLAQKTPFFGAHQQAQHDNAPGHINTTSGTAANTATNTTPASANMMRGQQHPAGPQQVGSVGGNNHQQQPQQRQALATTPTVDMSHLTEEERLMIQSVMAKAEMADMGMPVDTSVPSSTNMPSNASQALVQQQQQHQQQAKQQQLANQMMALGNQQALPQQQQHQQQHPQQQQQQRNIGSSGNQQDLMQQQQAQANMMHSNQGSAAGFSGHQQNVNQGASFSQPQQQYQQPQHLQQANYQQNMQNQPHNQQTNVLGSQPVNQVNASDAHSAIDARNTLPSLEQQTQQLVNQINSQFNLGQNQSQPASVAQRNIPLGQQPISSVGQFGNFNNPQANTQHQFQQPQQPQTQQPQLQNQQQQNLEQQLRLQQLSNYDQTFMAPGQGVGSVPGIVPQQINDNAMMGQQYPSTDPRQVQQNQLMQQQQQQQQQLKQQAQLNMMINDQQSRLMQPTNQRSQLELESSNINQMLTGSLIDPIQQQQQQLNVNSYQVNSQAPILQRQVQPTAMKVLDHQMNPIDTALGSEFNQPQQLGVTSIADPLGQRMASSNNLPSSAISCGQANANLNQQAINFNSESRLRQTPYDALCSEIKFGPQQIVFDHQDRYNDHALSDQEYGHSSRVHRSYADRRGIRRYESVDPSESRTLSKFVDVRDEPVDSREKNLQAYDLAQRNSPSRHSPAKPARQLPRPNQSHDQHVTLHSPNELSHDRNQNVNRTREKLSSGGSRKVTRRDIDQDSPNYLSESDEEINVESKKKDSNTESMARKSPNIFTKDIVDKNEEAIRVLSELKLTEQANQVMEQQQLLIKQSQELIKLQLEQQALSQELKKSIKQTTSSGDPGPSEQNIKKEYQDNLDKEEIDKRKTQQVDSSNNKNYSDDTTKAVNSSNEHSKLEEESQNIHQSSSKKSAYSYNDSDPDSPRTVFKAGTRFSETVVETDNMSRDKNFGKLQDRDSKTGGKASNLYNQNSTNSSSQTGPSPRYNRDLLQSPTDTTDSDVDSFSRSQESRRHQKFNKQQANKPKSVVRRREPTGLPPSPLPVAAAIQLHQMQQQHFRHQINSANVKAKNNFMRSRSVTSSPSYHLEQANNSGYLTDNQRNRSISPDTLSEFGGQRRRKRLPEPPTNTVPITPSMVRKMIQAQRIGSSASGRLLTSVNAHSTLLTNTHSTRNLAFERPPNNHDNTSTNFSRTSANNQDPYPSLNHPNRLTQVSDTSNTLPTTSSVNPISSQHINPTSGASDLNKFLSSTYGNSILRNNISDIKETPELDKLISNLDDYYGLDANKRHNRSLVHPSSDAQLATSGYNQTPIAGTSMLTSLSGASPTRGLISSTNYSINPTSNNYSHTRSLYPGNSTYSLRRSSEGESNLARLTARRPYRQANLDDSYRNYGRNFTSTSYLEGRNPSSYLNSSSPVRQSRYAGHIPTSEKLIRDYPSTSYADHYMESSTNVGKVDRNSSSYYRPISNQFSTHSRLHTNPTGSLDFENLDYLAPSTNEQRIARLTELPDILGSAGSSKYQNQLTGTTPDIDTSRERYRYSGLNDCSRYSRNDYNSPSMRYQTGGSTRNEYSGPRRSHMMSHLTTSHPQQRSFDLDTGSTYHNLRANLSPYETRSRDNRPSPYTDTLMETTNYTNDPMRHDSSTLLNMKDYSPQASYTDPLNRANVNSSSFAPLTKNDIINSGPKFNSIGYRFRTENQNKYVAQARNPIQCLQSRYPHPYKRILLSKNPKDRIGNGIGVRITGGQPIPNLYDRVNRCIISSGAFVTEVFQNSNVHFMGEMQEGRVSTSCDQIIEWNGVNLCNRSNEEVHQILLSQFSDDEVEIIYLPQNKFSSAYDEINPQSFNDMVEPDAFDTFADMNKSGRQSSVTPIVGRSRYGDEAPKGSIRRKLSLSHIAHTLWK